MDDHGTGIRFARAPIVKGRVLVVDDEPNIRSLISVALKRSGLDAISAYDGASAMDLLRESKFDLILLDLMMPRMSGTQFLDLLMASNQPLPGIILVTATPSQDLGKAEELVDAVIPKPFELSDLLDEVRRSLERRRGTQTEMA